MFRFVWPTVISVGSNYIARNAAQKQPTKAQAIATYHKTIRLVGWLAILGSVLYSIYDIYDNPNPLDNGSGAYGLLSIPPGATVRQISQGFRAKSRSVHPDKNPAAAAEYELITKANNILKQPLIRYVYDRFGSEIAGLFDGQKQLSFKDLMSIRFNSTLFYWVSSIVSVIIGAILTGNSVSWQLLILAFSCGLELLLITRHWYTWYLPWPIFQCIKIMRDSLPGIMGSITLVIPTRRDNLLAEIGQLQFAVQMAANMGEKDLDNLTAPYQSDEHTMERLRRAANSSFRGVSAQS